MVPKGMAVIDLKLIGGHPVWQDFRWSTLQV